jgi:6-phosphogluconate dehydrogenase
MPSDIAVYGLGVMGRNIALNMADHRVEVGVYNRTAAITESFVASLPENSGITPHFKVESLLAGLNRPRKVFLMAKAGPVIDTIIETLTPHLEAGDVIIDGGNSNFKDTQRRLQQLQPLGLHYVGMGISGGEEGARNGPSIMPGGDPTAWPLIREIFQSIAAQADDGEPCCRWVGDGGAGHYVKMIHNGIEYGDMQLIAEAWQLMRDGLGMTPDAIADTFATWNEGVLSSYLVGITSEILRVVEADGTPRVDQILDSAGQKGTGRWTAVDALETGVPLTLIAEAVFARMLSSRKQERVALAQRIGPTSPTGGPPTDASKMLDAVHDALYASKILSYTQGFMQMRAAAEQYGWQLAYGDIALLWRAGCIIRSRFLDDIARAFAATPDLPSLLFDEFFAEAVQRADDGWRRAVTLGVQTGIPVPAMSSALAFYDGYRSARLPANLLQAQRDYFGAHTYQRIDRTPGSNWHTRWTGDLAEESSDD